MLAMAGCSDQLTSPGNTETEAPSPETIPDQLQKLVDQYTPTAHGIPSEAQISYLDPIPTELIDNCDVYAVTFLWGDLFNASLEPNITTDWSGRLGINGEGIVHVRYMIDFEPGEDSVLIHDNPTFAAWISYTNNDIDGLSFLVFVRRDIVDVTPPLLIFDTAPIKLEFTFRQLVKFDAFYRVDNRNGLIVHSRKIWQNVCPSGEFKGRWLKESFNPDGGHFEARWLDRWGTAIGYLSGRYWINDDNRGEWAGTLSGLVTDEVIAEMHGYWYYDDPTLCPTCGDDHGVLVGRYKYIRGGSGTIKGEFGYGVSSVDIELPLTGVWRDDCPHITPGDLRTPSD